MRRDSGALDTGAVLDSGAQGLRFFEVFVPRYREWTGTDPVGGGYQQLAAGYDQQRGLDLDALAGFAATLGTEIEAGLAAGLATQRAQAQELSGHWNGSSAALNATQFLDGLNARTSAGLDALAAVHTAATIALTDIEDAVQVKADAARTGFAAETAAGRTPAQIDTILDGADPAGRTRPPDAQLQAALGEHAGDGTDLTASARRWLDEHFVPEINTRTAEFARLCAEADTTVTTAYTQLLTALESLDTSEFTSPGGQPSAATDLTHTAGRPRYQAIADTEVTGQNSVSQPAPSLLALPVDTATTPATTDDSATGQQPDTADTTASGTRADTDTTPAATPAAALPTSTTPTATETPTGTETPTDTGIPAETETPTETETPVSVPDATPIPVTPSSGTPGQWSPSDIANMVTAVSQITGTIPDLITAVSGLTDNVDEIITATGQAGAAVISAVGESAAAIIDATDNQPSTPAPTGNLPDPDSPAPGTPAETTDPEASLPGDPQAPVPDTGEDTAPVKEVEVEHSSEATVIAQSTATAPASESGLTTTENAPATIPAGDAARPSAAVHPGPGDPDDRQHAPLRARARLPAVHQLQGHDQLAGVPFCPAGVRAARPKTLVTARSFGSTSHPSVCRRKSRYSGGGLRARDVRGR